MGKPNNKYYLTEIFIMVPKWEELSKEQSRFETYIDNLFDNLFEDKKIKIVGGVAGGASVAARVRRLDEFAEVTMFERGPHVSFSNCALPFHLSGIVENSDDLVLMHPKQFAAQ